MQIYEKLPLDFKNNFFLFHFFPISDFVVVESSWLFGWLVECVRGEFKLKERISDLGQSHYQLRVCQSSSSL